jgi:hypothetical protein
VAEQKGLQLLQHTPLISVILPNIPQRNILDYLTAACEAALRGEAAPSLLPERDQKAHAAA